MKSRTIVNHYLKFARPAFVLSLAGCLTALTHCMMPDVRAVETRHNQAGRVGIGFIENRDLRFNPFSSKDFANMLEFELLKKGYSIQDLKYAGLIPAPETAAPPSESVTPTPAPTEPTKTDEAPTDTMPSESDTPGTSSGDAENSYAADVTGAAVVPPALAPSPGQASSPEAVRRRIYDDTYDLLPERLRTIAGENLAPRGEEQHHTDRALSMEEIRRVAVDSELDYFIQGAISRTETGLLLDLEENTLVFLEIFDASGRRVGAITLSVDNESLKAATFLQSVSERVAEAFHLEIHRVVQK